MYIKAADGQVPLWDSSVRFFVVKQEGQTKANFFLDPYSRPEEKRGGAWMDEVSGQSRLVSFFSMISAIRASWVFEFCCNTEYLYRWTALQLQSRACMLDMYLPILRTQRVTPS